MSKSIWKLLRSPVILLGISVLLVVGIMFHVVHKFTVQDRHGPTEVIDMLREKNLVFTKVEKDKVKSFPEKNLKDELVLAVHASSSVDKKPASVDEARTAAAAAAEEPISLPGGTDHRILGLSDAQFRSIPVSEMMGWYGQASGGGSCADDFGNNLITRWRDAKQTYCPAARPLSSHPHGANKGTADTEEVKEEDGAEERGAASGGAIEGDGDGVLNSHIDCYLVHQTRHHGSGDNLCHMRNVAVDLRLFADDSKTRPVVKTYVDTRHAKQPYIKFPKGFIEGDCSPTPALWKPINMPGWNADLTVGAYQQQQKSGAGAGDSVCAEWVTHPVLITQRDTFANFFHDSEDFFNVFIAMAVLQWKPSEVQMFLTDLYPKGPFWEMWSKVFSQGNEDVTQGGAMTAMTAWDLRQKYQHLPVGQKVCFRDLAVGIYGPAAPVTVASWDTPCSKTALVRAYSDYVIRGLQLQGHTHYAAATPSDTVVVTYMARRPSKEWPEKKYCDSEHSFFLCALWEGFGERSLGRMMRNDAAVVAALKALEGQRIGNAKKIVVQDVDYNILTFEEQIATDLATDIMIGPHGAGLMHNIFMRDRATLIELFVDGSSVNRHFHNLAFWYGRQYKGVSVHNPINIPELVALVHSAIENIDVSKY